jgi:hypothetical protein
MEEFIVEGEGTNGKAVLLIAASCVVYDKYFWIGARKKFRPLHC